MVLDAIFLLILLLFVFQLKKKGHASAKTTLKSVTVLQYDVFNHVWAGAPICYLELSDKLQKRIYRTVGLSLASSLEPLAHRRNVANLTSLFYRYYFGRYSSELAQVIPLPYSRVRSTRYSDGLHDFSVTIPSCYKDVYLNSFFLCTARLWNSPPLECFPSTF